MNKIDWTQTGGFPLRQDRLKFMQDGIAEAFSHLGRGPKIALSYDSNQKPIFVNSYILHGCKVSDNGDGSASVAAGAIFHNGEVLAVEPHTLSLSVASYPLYFFDLEVTDDPAGVKEYFDGGSHATQKIRQAKLGYEVYPDAGAWLGAAISKPLTHVTLGNNSSVFTSTMDFNLSYGSEINTGNLPAGGGKWHISHAGKLLYWRNANGLVTVTCSLIPVSGESISGLLCTLPNGFRPTYTVIAQSRFDTGNGQTEYARIGTDGTVRLEWENGTEVYGNKRVSFTVQYHVPN